MKTLKMITTAILAGMLLFPLSADARKKTGTAKRQVTLRTPWQLSDVLRKPDSGAANST